MNLRDRLAKWVVFYREVRSYPASAYDGTYMTVAEYTLLLADGKVSLSLILGRRRDTIE